MMRRVCTCIASAVFLSAAYLASCSSTEVCELPLQCCDLPKGREVRCTMAISPQPEGFVGSLYVGCEFNPIFIHSDSPCDVWVGMSVVVECVNDTELFREGRALGGPSLHLPSAGVDDGGVYECRDGRGSVVGQRNVTVHGEAVVATGSGSNNSCLNYYCNITAQCCKPPDTSTVTYLQSDLPARYPFNVHGEGPFDFTLDTLWSHHYPVDLQLELERDGNTTVWVLVIQRWPVTIVPSASPAVLVRVTANNSYSSSTACFPFSFTEPSPYLYASSSLPQNQTVAVGGTAVFECEMGTSTLTISPFYVKIEYIPPFNTTEEIFCSLNSGYCSCDSCLDVQVSVIDMSNIASTVYRYQVRILDVEIRDNGTVLSCALDSAQDGVQWKREATLIVTTAKPTGGRDDDESHDAVVYVGVALVAMVMLVTAVLVGLLYLRRCRLKHQHMIDAVPLQNDSSPRSSPTLDFYRESPEFTL